MLISVIAAPPNAVQTVVSQPTQLAPPPLNPLDQKIMAVLRGSGRYGRKVWSLLDQVAVSQNPASRSERRSLRLAAWSRLRRLLHFGMAHRFARENITAIKMPHLSVMRKGRSRLGSTIAECPSPREQIPTKQFCSKWLMKGPSQPATTGAGQLSESAKAIPAPVSPQSRRMDETRQAEVRAAAQSLAGLRGVKRRLSGYVGSVRPRVGQPILVGEGVKAFFGGARRGQVLFFLDADHRMERGRWGVVRATSVTILKNESASALGREKRGRVERKSELKARTSRANGRLPCRSGRRRGRPRRGPMPVF